MPYPSCSQILAILRPLSNPPAGNNDFFAHIRNDVVWTVTGHSLLSGTWPTKKSYRAATFANIGPLFAAPGMKLEILGGEESMITEVKAFMDTAHLEKVLGAELEKRENDWMMLGASSNILKEGFGN